MLLIVLLSVMPFDLSMLLIEPLYFVHLTFLLLIVPLYFVHLKFLLLIVPL